MEEEKGGRGCNVFSAVCVCVCVCLCVCVCVCVCVQVVPLALVCLLTGCSVSEAESRLEQQPIIREAVEACLA